MDTPEVHAPHGSHTGHRLFDFVVGGTALFVSLVSLYVAVHHGQIMEKLVVANSWPNVQISANVGRGATPESIRFELAMTNNGVGPARIETLEFWSGGKPIANVDQLGTAIKVAGGGVEFEAQIEGTTVIGRVLGAKETVTPTAIVSADGATWGLPMVQVQSELESRVCYCSVFDECYVADSRTKIGRTSKVKNCPTPAVPFKDNFTGLFLKKAVPNRQFHAP